ncbi:MAG: hypothetical protein JWP12_825 [Bacteroidetes bacterium]|nr:hypothetical protein [Bacteroidota bacterium]
MSAKTVKIIYWIATVLIALFVLPGIFFLNSPMAVEGSRHLGVPEWLRLEVGIGHFIGALILIIPVFGKRIKEWAYVALGIEYISAIIAHLYVDGVTSEAFFALIIFVILLISYIFYHKMKDAVA